VGKVLKMGVLENSPLKKIFGPETDEVIQDCRKYHSEKIHDF
jgi:hypothetical protein